MSIKRPKEFLEYICQKKKKTQETEEVQAECKIYMGGLPTYLDEEQVRNLCTTFGPLKSFHLVKDTSGD